MSLKEFAKTDVEAKKSGLPWGKWAGRKILGLLGLAALSMGCSASSGAFAGASTGAAFYVGPTRPARHCYVPERGAEKVCFQTEEELRESIHVRQRDMIARHNEKEKAAKAAKDAQFYGAIEQGKEHERQMAAAAKDPAIAVPVISAIMCTLDAKIGDLRSEQVREARITAAGNVSDLKATRELAEDLVAAQEGLEFWVTALAERFKTSRMACSSLRALSDCHGDAERCDESTALQDDLWMHGRDQLLGSNR